MTEAAAARLKIARGLRVQWEPAQNAHVLLYPEGMVELNDSAATILALCDGSRSAAEIGAHLAEEFGDAEVAADVAEFLAQARSQGWIEDA